MVCLSCGGGSSSSSSGSSNPGAQQWIIDAGPDPVQQGREEEATITIQPFTTMGAFNEVEPDPLGGMLLYSPDGTCNYQVQLSGNISNGNNSTIWDFGSGSTGHGCGTSTTASGTLDGIGTFPSSTSASGTVTFTTQGPLGVAVDSGTWNAYLQSSGSQVILRKRADEQLHNPKTLYDIFRGFQPLDFRLDLRH
jgi:hypothetical protein